MDVFAGVPTISKNPILRELHRLSPQAERVKTYLQDQFSKEFETSQASSLRMLDEWQAAIEQRWDTLVQPRLLQAHRLIRSKRS
jgi:hypothetical protein